MRIELIWGAWGLPFGFSTGGDLEGWRWAVSFGPLHLIWPR